MKNGSIKAIDSLLTQADVVSEQASHGSYAFTSFEELQRRADNAAKFNPVASALPSFVISQLDGWYAQGKFEIAQRDELHQDIRRWPNLG